ncbi:hypothetical protein ISS21_00270 [Patescibacteria group bacterium]|nr:hypothetical protein [Patescibacteria group bacterium]
MYFYDLIHGYQPFDPGDPVPKWIKGNLKQIFLPTSLAMKKGLIPRGVQLQGWTIDVWLAAKKPIRDLAKKTFNNLKIANQKGNIEIGISAYSHPILPMLSSDLIQAQILLDKEVVEQYLGKATWFWPPEGAIDRRVLKIIHQTFPNLILLIPDKAIGRYNFSGPIKIKFPASACLAGRRAAGRKKDFQKAIVFNTLLKDLFMNAEDYRRKPKYIKRPKHLPDKLVWSQVRRIVHSPKVFLQVLEYLRSAQNSFTNYESKRITNKFKSDCFVLMRDWENAGSKRGLRKIKGAVPEQGLPPKEIGNFLKFRNQTGPSGFARPSGRINFCLPSQFNWQRAEIIPISKIIPCSWDMESTPKDPFPWWQPNKYGAVWRKCKPFRRKRMIEWQELIKEFNQIFQQRIKQQGGLKKALKNKEFKDLLKRTLPALHSCIGWHYFAKRAWKPDYQYSQQALKNIVLPGLKRLKNL